MNPLTDRSLKFKFDILGPYRRWREKKRIEKKRQLIAHQEVYAQTCKAEEHRKAERIQKSKHNMEKQIRDTLKLTNELNNLQ